MGKNKKNWRGKANTSKSKEKKAPDEHGNQWVQEFKNDKFEEYYKAQNLMLEDEWPKFMQALRDPLPTTFRLAGSRETVHELNNIIRSTYVPQLSDVTFEGEKVPPPVQIPWYPEGLAWHLKVPKSVIRRSPEFKRFHNFLVYETDVGNISRQEAVSMIPPLFLDVQPHHLVLDMCAAPGSKTAQLLEAMHAPSPAGDASQIPSGLLIANDSDFKRTHLLVHQSARLPSPALMVTNLDASNYPNIALAAPPSMPGPAGTLKFDRILCDVPCSGDGTLRKNIGIWGHWQPMDGNGLHGLQLRILLRAMKLLKSAGRIVYSTCSLNPVENEAVIAAALKAAPDFELVDVSSLHPALVRKPGLETWSPVVDKELTAFPSYSTFLDDWKAKNTDEKAQQNQIKMAETHWPPEDVASLHLARCMRIYPHLQDMGGFFVAVLRRKDWKALEATEQAQTHPNGKRAASQEPETSPPDAKRVKVDGQPSASTEPSAFGLKRAASQKHIGADTDSRGAEAEGPSGELGEMAEVRVEDLPIGTPPAPPDTLADPSTSKVKGKNKGTGGKKGKEKEKDKDGKFKEPPYTFLEPDHPQLQQTIERLALRPSFPTSNIFVRHPNGGGSTVPLRSMYLCNDIVKCVILANDYARMRLVSAGTKVLTRQDAGGTTNEEGDAPGTRQQFRILDDAVSVVLPFIPPQSVLSGGLSELRTLLDAYYPLIGSFEEPFQSTIGGKRNGNYLVRFDAGELNGALLSHPIVLPLWKSNASMSLMTDKKSKSALSLRVFGEDITVAGKQVLEQQRLNQARRDAANAKETEGGRSSALVVDDDDDLDEAAEVEE